MTKTPIWCSTSPGGKPELVQAQRVKGSTTMVFSAETAAGLSARPIDCSDFNAVVVMVYPNGAGASATVSVEGSGLEGGYYLPLSDSEASQSAVTAATSFDVMVGVPWIKVRLADITGSFTIYVTPYVSPGSTRVLASLVVDSLSAIVADMGTLTAGSIVIGTTNKIWLNDSADGGLAIGGAVKASAPFRVSATGALTATNATITGAGGDVTLTSSGLSITQGTGTTNRVAWTSSGVTKGYVLTYTTGDLSYTRLAAQSNNAAHDTTVVLTCDPGGSLLTPSQIILSHYGSLASYTCEVSLNNVSCFIVNPTYTEITNGALKIGALSTAASGSVRMKNAEWIAARNAANNADLNMWQVNSDNRIQAGTEVYFPNSVGVGVASPLTAFHGATSTIIGTANSNATGASMGNSQTNIYLDEINHRIYFYCKYSDGTLKSGYVALS